jgi:hypothetical protein
MALDTGPKTGCKTKVLLIFLYDLFPRIRENVDEELQLFEQEEEEKKNLIHDEYELKFLCVGCKSEERYDGVLRESGEIGLLCPKVDIRIGKTKLL